MTGDPVLADALAHLTRRDYARAELEKRLLRKEHPAAAVERALDRCEELGYLDDRAFARSRAEAYLRRKPRGRIAVVRDLRRQGVASTMSEQVADEVLADLGGEKKILSEALQRWIERHGEPSEWRDARRCADHLTRRGFAATAVQDALSPWLDEIAG